MSTPSRLPRVVSAVLGVIALAAVVPLACSGFPFPPGYIAGPVLGVPSSCDGDAYLAVPAQDCPSSQCPGPVAFAVCGGTSFTGCTCSQPPGVLVPALDAGEEEGFSVDPCDSGCGFGGVECIFEGGGDGEFDGEFDSPVDAPLFDVGDRGDCSGEVAERVPASECGSCDGRYAYLLCDGLFYSVCSCDLPPGYSLVDGGAPEAGPKKDAGK
jgi:hypothetical protein